MTEDTHCPTASAQQNGSGFSWTLDISFPYILNLRKSLYGRQSHAGDLSRHLPHITHGQNFLVAVSCPFLEKLDRVVEALNCKPL